MELLKKLYEIHSPSGKEKKLKRVIRGWVERELGESVKISYDNKGNMYLVKGVCEEGEYYPCVVAHLDQVQRSHSRDFKVIYDSECDMLFGFSKKKKEFEGLGADDKNGVWIGLRCLEKFDVIKVAFFVEEEIGCGGSGETRIKFFNDVRYILECDRRGSSDLITSICGLQIASDAFIKDVTPIATRYGYTKNSGMMTDVLELSERGVGVSCVNMSCGYYDPHTDGEFTIWEDLVNTLAFVCEIIETLKSRYPLVVEYSCYGHYGGYGGNYGFYGHGRSYNNGSLLKEDIEPSWDGGDYFYNEETGCWEWKSTNNEEITILKSGDFCDVESFIDQFLFENIGRGYPEDLYQYVAADLETFGWTEVDFVNYVYDNYEDYFIYGNEEV